MNRPIAAAAALVLGLAIAAPMLAWSADPPPPDQPVPGGPPPEHRPMMHGPGMMGMDRPETPDGMGGREGRGAMGREEWHRRMMFGMMRLSPKQRCEERLARRAGRVAYTIAKLNLTAQQRSLWDKVQAQLQDAGNKMHELCSTLPSGEQRGEASVLDRMNRRMQFLSARLQSLQQTQPLMQQLYQSLTADQKAIIDHPFRHP